MASNLQQSLQKQQAKIASRQNFNISNYQKIPSVFARERFVQQNKDAIRVLNLNRRIKKKSEEIKDNDIEFYRDDYNKIDNDLQQYFEHPDKVESKPEYTEYISKKRAYEQELRTYEAQKAEYDDYQYGRKLGIGNRSFSGLNATQRQGYKDAQDQRNAFEGRAKYLEYKRNLLEGTIPSMPFMEFMNQTPMQRYESLFPYGIKEDLRILSQKKAPTADFVAPTPKKSEEVFFKDFSAQELAPVKEQVVEKDSPKDFVKPFTEFGGSIGKGIYKTSLTPTPAELLVPSKFKQLQADAIEFDRVKPYLDTDVQTLYGTAGFGLLFSNPYTAPLGWALAGLQTGKAGKELLESPSYYKGGEFTLTALPFLAKARVPNYFKTTLTSFKVPKEFRGEYKTLLRLEGTLRENLASKNIERVEGMPKDMLKSILNNIKKEKRAFIGGTTAIETSGIKLKRTPRDIDVYVASKSQPIKNLANNIAKDLNSKGYNVQLKGEQVYWKGNKIFEAHPAATAYGNIGSVAGFMRSTKSYIKKTPDGTRIIDPLILVKRKLRGGFEPTNRFLRKGEKPDSIRYKFLRKGWNKKTGKVESFYKVSLDRYSKDIPAFAQAIKQLSVKEGGSVYAQYQKNRANILLKSFKDLIKIESKSATPNRKIVQNKFVETLSGINFMVKSKKGTYQGIPLKELNKYGIKKEKGGYYISSYKGKNRVSFYPTKREDTYTPYKDTDGGGGYLPPPREVTDTPYYPTDPYPPISPYKSPPPITLVPKKEKEKKAKKKDIDKFQERKAYQTVYYTEKGKKIKGKVFSNKIQALAEGVDEVDYSPLTKFNVKKVSRKNKILSKHLGTKNTYKFKKKGDLYIERVPFRKDKKGEKDNFNTLKYVFN